MHRIYSEYKASESSMHNLICRSGSCSRQLRQTASLGTETSRLPFVLLVETRSAERPEPSPTLLLQESAAASSLYFSSYRVSAEHRYSFQQRPASHCCTHTCPRAAPHPQASPKHHRAVPHEQLHLLKGRPDVTEGQSAAL